VDGSLFRSRIASLPGVLVRKEFDGFLVFLPFASLAFWREKMCDCKT